MKKPSFRIKPPITTDPGSIEFIKEAMKGEDSIRKEDK